MVVVVVAEEHHGDRRKIVEADRRLRARFGPARRSGLARCEYIGSVRMLPDGVWIRNVEWPTKVARPPRRRAGAAVRGGSIAARPRRAPLEQHARHRRERLPGRADGLKNCLPSQ